MAQGKGWLVPARRGRRRRAPPTDITENGIRYTVDFENGQKTGFFLDQKYNRLAVAQLAKGRTVLDCFTHTGSFALNAAKGGAKHVTAVDVSQFAVDMRGGERAAQRAGRRDGLRVRQRVRPAAAAGGAAAEIRLHHPGPAGLHQEPQDHTQRHDRVQGDQLPGHEAAAPGRVSGHLLLQPLRVRRRCSSRCCADAARDAGVQLRQIEARQQCADHPILWGVEETNYLKFFIFQVV